VEEVLARDFWSAAQWKTWQENELEKILNLAARHVPYYRDLWDKKRRSGDRSSVAYLENWPILKKETLRKTPKAFLVEGTRESFLNEEHTSGTSGKPLRLWRSHRTDQLWYAIYEARVRRWNNVSRKDRWAIVGGQIVVPAHQTKPPFWVWNAGLNQLYLSAYHIQAETVGHYSDALRKHQVVYLLGYPSALSALANMVLESGQLFPHLKLVITNAEMLLPAQRRIIQEAFCCRVVNTYGMSEIVAAASECPEGTMHLWPDTGVTEILRMDSLLSAQVGERGRLICTGLINQDMPLIRYEVGDMAVREDSTKCPCGRSLPEMGEIEGRLDDMLITIDGRFVGRLDSIFKVNLPVKEAQIIQENSQLIHLKVVPSQGYGTDTRQTLSELIRERLGDVKVEVEELSAIPRDANGKFKAVVSKVKKINKG
jgi:phenylacetate-CoA ligase